MEQNFKNAVLANNKLIIDNLFRTDVKLVKTIPTKLYPIDLAKVKFLIDNQCSKEAYEMMKNFKWRHYDFNTWKDLLAEAITKLVLLKYGLQDYKMIISKPRNVKGKWIDYIFRKVMEKLGYKFHDENESWYSISQNSWQTNNYDLVFVEDFIRDGSKIAKRIVKSPYYSNYIIQNPKAKTYIVSVVSSILELLKEDFVISLTAALEEENISNIPLIVSGISSSVEFISGDTYDPRDTQHVFFDHRNEEKVDPIIYYGYIYSVPTNEAGDLRDLRHCKVVDINDSFQNAVFVGSLLQGSDPLSDDKYPPPLYHLTFGNGIIPKNKMKLKLLPGMRGFYVKDSLQTNIKKILSPEEKVAVQDSQEMKQKGLERVKMPTSLVVPESRRFEDNPGKLKSFGEAKDAQVPKPVYYSNPLLAAVKNQEEKSMSNEAFCDKWLEKHEYNDEEGMTAFLDYASHKGLINQTTKDSDITKLCEIFKSKAQQKKKSKIPFQTNNSITISKVKSHQEIEKEEIQKLLREKERQEKARSIIDNIISSDYNTYFSHGDKINQWQLYQKMMANALNEEILNPTNDYEDRWKRLSEEFKRR